MLYQHFKGEPNVRRSTPGLRVTALALLAATLILGLSRSMGATTINANSASQFDVAAAIASTADGSSFRMDHCKWNDLNGYIVFDTVIGVIDHDSFISGNHLNCIYIYGSGWNGQGPYGDGSWTAPVSFGSSDFLFFEDCDFHNSNPTFMSYVTDALNGARYVVRHSTVFNAYFTDHGTESGGRERGARAM